MPDLTARPATDAPHNAAQDPAQDPARVGEQLGQAVAGLVILNMHAMQAGRDHGYEWESLAATHCPMPERLAYIPRPFAVVPVVADAYQREFTQGRRDYHADQTADQSR